MINKSDEKEPRFRPYQVIHQKKSLKSPIVINGEKVTRYLAPVIVSYVDMTTGEVIPSEELRGNPEVWPTMHFSERCLQRQFILNSLRKEVREFALFVLAFANQRRGVTPWIDQLVKWYAQLHGKRSSDVRRYVAQLEDSGIIAGSSLLGPLFQYSGKKTTAKSHLSEDAEASLTFLRMTLKHKGTEDSVSLMAA